MTENVKRAVYYDPNIFRYSFSNAELEAIGRAFPHEGSLSLMRQVVTHCWLKLPVEERNIHSVAMQVDRFVEEALRELEEDCNRVRAEGKGKGGQRT